MRKGSSGVRQWVFVTVLAFQTQLLLAEQLAFPGAEGFGAYAKGGRGGDVCYVTNTNDSGEGSLREAIISAAGPRTIVFAVSGLIQLQSKLEIDKNCITIAGQTAPGDGICLRDYPLIVSADHVIVRFIRSRLGDESGCESDAISISSGHNIIMDHCSASWSVDEVFSCSTARRGVLDNVTVQWSIISEALNNSIHHKGIHGYGALIRGCCGARYSYHHNLFAHNKSRNPRPGNYDSNPYTSDPLGLEFDFRNNVVYNWNDTRPSYDADTDSVCRINYVNNYFKAGPNGSYGHIYEANCKHFKGYYEGNYFNGGIPSDQYSMVDFCGWSKSEINNWKQTVPFSTGPIITQTAQDAYASVIKHVGASLARDPVDTRVINDVIHGTGAIIDSQEQVGGWPMYKSATAPTDSDQDGMPDTWEKRMKLDADNPEDKNADADGDGYTNLEEYLNSLVCYTLGETYTVQKVKQFEPTAESLKQYECPEWFRDAKFGIYVHWGVYSVAEYGEWYGKNLYVESNKPDSAYVYHVKKYGHPSKFGYKDLIPMWKAENFDPDAWLTLFKDAGAKYFTPCAVHHDGFDLWDSKYQRFNAVNMGPKKDLIAMMRKATKEHGLHFGVTTHLARSLSWMQRSHGSDKKGPLKGVPYDGNDPKFVDLYHPALKGKTYSGDTKNAPKWWCDNWYNRLKDLIDNYNPELLYLDSGIPFLGEDNAKTGMRLMAYYYNKSSERNNGKQECVYTMKKRGKGRCIYIDGASTLDLERSKADRLYAEPWQTDDSIGPWGYTAGVEYKTVNAVIDKLIDIVSKNGNLLLNVPPKADGTFDKETIDILKGIGKWMKVNGEGIYNTRPWLVFGEGPDTKMDKNSNKSPYTAANIRFTRSKDGRNIYVIALGWPEKSIIVKSLAKGGMLTGEIKSVRLLGHSGQVSWNRNEEGLLIEMPRKKPCEHAFIWEVSVKP